MTEERRVEEFGEPVFVYTRAQAIEDGQLVDVSTAVGRGVVGYPVVVTADVWAEIVVGRGKRREDSLDRVRDVIWMASGAFPSPDRRSEGFRAPFSVYVGRRRLDLLVDLGGGDEGEPVLTIGFPGDF